MIGDDTDVGLSEAVVAVLAVHHWHSDSHGVAGWCECKHRNVDNASEWRVHVATAMIAAVEAAHARDHAALRGRAEVAEAKVAAVEALTAKYYRHGSTENWTVANDLRAALADRPAGGES